MGKKLFDRDIGPMTILFGVENGKYPQGNSLLIQGGDKTVMIDPCLGIISRNSYLPHVDEIFLTHVHEDHVSGMHLYPDAPCYAHKLDAMGLASMEEFLQIFGVPDAMVEDFATNLRTMFNYQSRSSVSQFADGDRFDFGGVRLEVMHSPGHTHGHSCFIIDWDGSDERLVCLGDIDLTGFGPYYGDAWSNLEDFESSLEKLKSVDAKWWLTFHHKGLIESREEFLVMLENYRKKIDFRESNLLEFLTEPRTMVDIVEHRFIYRPGTGGMMVDHIESRSIAMHLDRLLRTGQVELRRDKWVRV